MDTEERAVHGPPAMQGFHISLVSESWSEKDDFVQVLSPNTKSGLF